MAETSNAGPATNGTGAEQVSQTSRKTTYRWRLDAIGWHRRNCKAFDRWALDYYGEELCARYGITPDARRPVAYASGGMTFGYDARERAA